MPTPPRSHGRPKGSPNKINTLLKDAIIRAAEVTGEDGKGKDGLIGYLAHLAQTEPRSFASLLGRIIPLQMTGDEGGPVQVNIVRFAAEMSDDELAAIASGGCASNAR